MNNFCLLYYRWPNRVWNSPSPSFAQSILWIQYFHFATFPSSESR